MIVDKQLALDVHRLNAALSIGGFGRTLEVIADGGFAGSIVTIKHIDLGQWSNGAVGIGRVAGNAAQNDVFDHGAVLAKVRGCQRASYA